MVEAIRKYLRAVLDPVAEREMEDVNEEERHR
jgi:hypothetical protein